MTVSAPVSARPFSANRRELLSPSRSPTGKDASGAGISALVLSWVKPIADSGPVLLLGIALLGIACASIFVVIAEQDLSPQATAFNRLLIAAIAFSVWNGYQRLGQGAAAASLEPISLRQKALLGLAGISFAASLTLAAWSLTETSVANSTLLNNMMPIFTTVGGWAVLGQRFSRRFLVGMGVAILGAIAIGFEDFQAAQGNFTGDLAALLAAVMLAVAILSVEQLRVRFSTPMLMMWMSGMGSVLIFPVVVFSHTAIFPSSWMSGFAVLGLALVSQVMGHGLLTHSLKQFSSGLVSVSMLAIPVIAACLALVIFAETLSVWNVLAFLLVLLGIYLSVSAPKVSQEAKR